MARIDDYKKAVEIGKEELRRKDPKRTANLTGAGFGMDTEGREVITLNFLNKNIDITWPSLEFCFKEAGNEVPVQQEILLLHYLNGSTGMRVKEEWIAYQEVPDGRFYLDAFLRRAKNPMVQAFGKQPGLLMNLAEETYGARPLDQADFSVVVQAFPMVPVALLLWEGDDEFEPEGNILFDRSISYTLSAEDIAWLAGMIIYPLIGMAMNR